MREKWEKNSLEVGSGGTTVGMRINYEHFTKLEEFGFFQMFNAHSNLVQGFFLTRLGIQPQ